MFLYQSHLHSSPSFSAQIYFPPSLSFWTSRLTISLPQLLSIKGVAPWQTCWSTDTGDASALYVSTQPFTVSPRGKTKAGRGKETHIQSKAWTKSSGEEDMRTKPSSWRARKRKDSGGGGRGRRVARQEGRNERHRSRDVQGKRAREGTTSTGWHFRVHIGEVALPPNHPHTPNSRESPFQSGAAFSPHSTPACKGKINSAVWASPTPASSVSQHPLLRAICWDVKLNRN